MSWLDKLLPPRIQRSVTNSRKSMPEGLWVKCPSCEEVLYRTDLESSIHVCPKCSHHMRIRARDRLEALLDAEGRYEIGHETLPIDSLKFRDSKKYPDRLKAALGAPPTTGLLMIDLLSRSPATRVSLYGFDFFASQSLTGSRTAAQVPHDFAAERAFTLALMARDPRFHLRAASALTE